MDFYYTRHIILYWRGVNMKKINKHGLTSKEFKRLKEFLIIANNEQIKFIQKEVNQQIKDRG